MQWFSNCKFIGSKTPLRLNLISRFSPICCASFIKLWKVNTTERPMKNLEKRNSLLVAVTPARRTYNVLGLLAGFIGSKIVNKSGEGVLLDILLGIVGAVVGGWLFSLFGAHGVTGLNIYSFVVAVVGAIVVLVVYHAIKKAV